MARVPEWEPQDSPAYVYEQLAAHLQARIAAGEFAPGARLPNERELRSEYAVSFGTVRSAMRLLQERRLVVVRPSKGVFVAFGARE